MFEDWITKTEIQMRKGIGKEYKKHLKEMPKDLNEKWSATMLEFFKSFSLEESTFKTYFAGKNQNDESKGANQPKSTQKPKPADD